MRWFTKKCHKAGLSAGAFVFAPSLAWAVGQRADAFQELDLVSPMLYRAWPAEEPGPATLSHEWAGLMELLSRTEHHPQKLARYLFDLMFFTSDPLSGFAPEHLTMETDAMKGMFGGKMPVLPIVQANDPRLRDSVRAVLSGGADGYGEFSYSLKYV